MFIAGLAIGLLIGAALFVAFLALAADETRRDRDNDER